MIWSSFLFKLKPQKLHRIGLFPQVKLKSKWNVEKLWNACRHLQCKHYIQTWRDNEWMSVILLQCYHIHLFKFAFSWEKQHSRIKQSSCRHVFFKKTNRIMSSDVEKWTWISAYWTKKLSICKRTIIKYRFFARETLSRQNECSSAVKWNNKWMECM